MAILIGLGIALVTFVFLWIHSTISYKKRMKPLNEEVERQRKEAEERRRRMFSS
jgi:heme exporter protein D